MIVEPDHAPSVQDTVEYLEIEHRGAWFQFALGVRDRRGWNRVGRVYYRAWHRGIASDPPRLTYLVEELLENSEQDVYELLMKRKKGSE